MANIDEWENDDSINEDGDNINEADDSFGLPEYDSENTSEEVADNSYDYDSSYTEESSYETGYEEEGEYEPGSFEPKYKESRAPLIITLIVLVLIVGAALGYFFYFKPIQEKEVKFKRLVDSSERLMKENKYDAAIAKLNEAIKINPNDPLIKRKKREAQEAKQQEEEQIAEQVNSEVGQAVEDAEPEVENRPPGTVQTISSRTGRYYVVIASAVDGDLANDYAKKLAKEGSSPSILAPVGKKPFYRVAIAEHESWADAQGDANDLKSQYGDAVWVIRY